MTRPFRYLGELNSSSSDSSDSSVVDSDFVVILAALLCALICVLGLVAVARCGCLRRLRISSTTLTSTTTPPAAANKGVKKKVLRSLPKHTATAESAVKFSDCAICLSEFTAGDEIRVLPQCGHGFHVSCIDAWLRSHSSCPSCRQILVVSRCDKCGGIPVATATATNTAACSSSAPALVPEPETRLKVREDDGNRFLP
ncbi:RING-H2 finger protein ATL80 [Cicer arietinum]|uniref:RING-H2 finger protein ATL80 n=1 Tax=Cicer arietinum TaxID=3827 RepID=A0A1S2Y821_CICAR|nr:RING-H2 finger protein ATL80 [Cicer arietinum]